MTLCLIGPIVLLALFVVLTALRFINPGSPNADMLVEVFEMERNLPPGRGAVNSDFTSMMATY